MKKAGNHVISRLLLLFVFDTVISRGGGKEYNPHPTVFYNFLEPDL